MTTLRRLVLDLLKPHDPDMVAFAERITECPGVHGVNASLIESDHQVDNIKITVEGEAIDREAVEAAIEDLGGSVHSIDEVVSGRVVVEASETPQDG